MPKLAIVVPVYNGAADVARCLAALARHRPPGSTILLADDASTDPAVGPMLDQFAAANADVRVLRNPQNAGFIVTANRGAQAAAPDADIVFLNSDTEVTQGWAEEMQAALQAAPGSAVCCPLSNNATYLSVPKFQQANDLPTGHSADDMAALVRRSAGDLRAVPGPTPVGFCMWVRRDAWDRFGPFDTAYGSGYGEEDDFGQRVQAAGRSVVCATRAFVYHHGGASFAGSVGLAGLRRANAQLLASRWPQYAVNTQAWCRRNPLRPLHEKIWRALLAPPTPNLVHVLHVVDRWELTGDLRKRMLEIVSATRDFVLNTVLVPTPDRGAWLDAIDLEFDRGIRVVGLIDFEERFEGFLAACAPSLVHFHAPEEWMPAEMVENVRKQYAVLSTPGGIAPAARAAEVYRSLIGR